IALRPDNVSGVVEFVRDVLLRDEVAVAVRRQRDALESEGRRALEARAGDGVVYAELFIEAVIARVDALGDEERAREREAELAQQSRREDVCVIDRRDFVDRRVYVLEAGQQRRHSERAGGGDELGSLRARVARADAIFARKLMLHLGRELVVVNLI